MYMTRFMSGIGLNKLAKTKGYLLYNWDKKVYMPRSEWYKPQKQEFVKQKDKPVAELIKNEVV